ncbi:hypothetical protein ACFQI9_37170 [Paraburkholderia dipogonis]|uniref:hypothetical protein n=1 Tax=Paraburkholderia dipogonis TaxID=1211383 RepID=UPI0036074BA7
MLSAPRRKLSEMKQPRDAITSNGCLFLWCLDKTMTAGIGNAIDIARRHGFLTDLGKAAAQYGPLSKKAITRRCRQPS